MRTITIRYKCKCLSTEVGFEMRERLRDEDILDYVEHMRRAIGVDHNNRSPLCVATCMEYAKMPVEGDVIGGAGGGNA